MTFTYDMFPVKEQCCPVNLMDRRVRRFKIMIFLPRLVWPHSNQSAVSWPAEIRPTCKGTENQLQGIYEQSTED